MRIRFAVVLQTPVRTQFMLVETGFECSHRLFGLLMLIFLGFDQFLQDLMPGFFQRRNLGDATRMQLNARLAGLATVNQHELGVIFTFTGSGPIGTSRFCINTRHS
jgi:hypothetical protein